MLEYVCVDCCWDGWMTLSIDKLVPCLQAVVRNGGVLGERKVVHIAGVSVHNMNSSMQVSPMGTACPCLSDTY
jgi:hypothetical protein